eukprot:scaffold32752_cov42-Cyclotella_meneghiniana.AAC.5
MKAFDGMASGVAGKVEHPPHTAHAPHPPARTAHRTPHTKTHHTRLNITHGTKHIYRTNDTMKLG